MEVVMASISLVLAVAAAALVALSYCESDFPVTCSRQAGKTPLKS